MGADVPDSTLLDWCGRAMKVLEPVIERIEAAIMAAPILHADDTPIRGLGNGVNQGRIWAYVSDQRPWAGTAPPRRGLPLLTESERGASPSACPRQRRHPSGGCRRGLR